MYDRFQLILSGVMVLFGIFMIAFPKQATKKQFRDDPEKVAKVRFAGVVWIICGAVLLILDLVIDSM